MRPFFHHGATISFREFAVGAFKAEMGLEACDPVLCAATDQSQPSAGVSPSGFAFDPRLDRVERPPVCDGSADGDGDGIVNEIDPALIDSMEFYLLNDFKPGLGRQTRRTREGLALMQSVGCTSCHVQNLVVERDRRVADVETVHDPQRGIFNRLYATATPLFMLRADADPLPLRLRPAAGRPAPQDLRVPRDADPSRRTTPPRA